jgi:hypothetical protein
MKINHSHMNKLKSERKVLEKMQESFLNILYNIHIFLNSTEKLALLKKQLRFRFFEFWFQLTSILHRRRTPPINLQKSKRALIVGYFSFPGGGGTFGDIEVMQIVCDWLVENDIKYDVASNIEDGVKGININTINEMDYGIFIFVCGPWYSKGRIHTSLIKKFDHCVKIGVNLTTFEDGNLGFDFLLSRDNFIEHNADIALASIVNKLPIVGILLVDRQMQYGIKQRHMYIRKVITEYINMGCIAPMWLDTNANNNKVFISNNKQYESLICRTDLVVTNRLHGLVLCIKNSIPVIAIDPIVGGGKVSAQSKALGWPILITAEEFTIEKLQECIDYCLNTDLTEEIKTSQQKGLLSIEKTRYRFQQFISRI